MSWFVLINNKFVNFAVQFYYGLNCDANIVIFQYKNKF